MNDLGPLGPLDELLAHQIVDTFATVSQSDRSWTEKICAMAGAHEPVRARHGMIVADEPFAADAGVAVLKAGGNAVDAAVAVGFALAVTHPYAGNIGGGGFMLVRFADGRSTFIDFRERAPEKASRDMYLDAQGNPTRDSLDGWRSVGVPGSVRAGRRREELLPAPA